MSSSIPSLALTVVILWWSRLSNPFFHFQKTIPLLQRQYVLLMHSKRADDSLKKPSLKPSLLQQCGG